MDRETKLKYGTEGMNLEVDSYGELTGEAYNYVVGSSGVRDFRNQDGNRFYSLDAKVNSEVFRKEGKKSPRNSK